MAFLSLNQKCQSSRPRTEDEKEKSFRPQMSSHRPPGVEPFDNKLAACCVCVCVCVCYCCDGYPVAALTTTLPLPLPLPRVPRESHHESDSRRPTCLRPCRSVGRSVGDCHASLDSTWPARNEQTCQLTGQRLAPSRDVVCTSWSRDRRDVTART